MGSVKKQTLLEDFFWKRLWLLLSDTLRRPKEICKKDAALKASALQEAPISELGFCTALTAHRRADKLRLAIMCLPALEVRDDASSTAHVFPRPCPHFPVLNSH